MVVFKVAQGELAEEADEPYQEVDVLEGPDLVTYRQRRTFYGRIMCASILCNK